MCRLKVIKTDCTDPYVNLAAEEYLTMNAEDGVMTMFLWQNAHTVVIGKNQNPWRECNVEAIKRDGIYLARRISGGGAVYHDMGNLNFTFIMCKEDYDLDKQVTVIQKACALAGIQAEKSGRNDLLADGRKFSGNAQTVVNGRILHHGTILFNTDISILSKALTPDPEKIQSKGIKSVSSRVVNLSELLPEGMDASRLTALLSDEVCEMYGASEYELSETELKRAEKLADEKYRTWDWNFGYSPKYTFTKKKRFDGGTVSAFITVYEGKIEEIKIFGDFFGVMDVSDIETALIGKKHNESAVREALMQFEIGNYFGKICLSELLEVLL